MGLRLVDKWVWDFWLAEAGGEYHVFHLQAPRSLGDPELRHWNATIGHATSTNLRDWRIEGTALDVATAPAWDDTTLWTGCVLKHHNVWYLFYTSTQRGANNTSVQRIGLATSTDLTHWHRHPDNPLVVADERWYEVLDESAGVEETWRDPWVFWHQGKWHMLITARANTGTEDERGVIGHATSDDLIHWTVQPPLDTPTDFGHMEVPQVVEIGGCWYLFFCVSEGMHSASRLARPGSAAVDGVHYLRGKSPLGPFERTTDEFLLGSKDNALYAGRVIITEQGPMLMAWKNKAPDGSFIGELDDPMPLHVDDSGHLHLTQS